VNNLETNRLLLYPLEPDRDAPFVLEVLNEPAFINNVADRGVRSVAEAAEYIRKKIVPSYEQFGFGFYIVELKDSHTPVGMCGLLKRETLEDVDIGYSILERFWRNGYAYEAASALMAHGRSELGLQRIVGITSPTNHSSAMLLEKLGLRFERMVQLPGHATESRLFG